MRMESQQDALFRDEGIKFTESIFKSSSFNQLNALTTNDWKCLG